MSLDVHLIERTTIYSANITHNLGKMAAAAGLYHVLWRPDELGLMRSGDLIVPLREGLKTLEATPDEFRKYNPENGWGTYEDLVEFVRAYLKACEASPGCEIRASR